MGFHLTNKIALLQVQFSPWGMRIQREYPTLTPSKSEIHKGKWGGGERENGTQSRKNCEGPPTLPL